jgi:hypothetical protein
VLLIVIIQSSFTEEERGLSLNRCVNIQNFNLRVAAKQCLAGSDKTDSILAAAAEVDRKQDLHQAYSNSRGTRETRVPMDEV